MWESFRRWLILKLGGYWDGSPRAHMGALLGQYIPSYVTEEAQRAHHKVMVDPSFKGYHGSNLGRNIKRDEASEWAKLYLKDKGYAYRDSDVNLACELIYHIYTRAL